MEKRLGGEICVTVSDIIWSVFCETCEVAPAEPLNSTLTSIPPRTNKKVQPTFAPSQLTFKSKPFNFLAHDAVKVFRCSSKQCIWVSLYSQSCEKQGDATQRHERSETLINLARVGFGYDTILLHILNELNTRQKPGQCSNLDHTPQSALSACTGIWCWFDKRKCDKYL